MLRLPGWTTGPLAIGATTAEIGLGVGLLLGVRVRLVAALSACLIATYGLCMTLASQAVLELHFVVPPLAAAMFVLSLAPAGPPRVRVDARRWLRRG